MFVSVSRSESLVFGYQITQGSASTVCCYFHIWIFRILSPRVLGLRWVCSRWVQRSTWVTDRWSGLGNTLIWFSLLYRSLHESSAFPISFCLSVLFFGCNDALLECECAYSTHCLVVLEFTSMMGFASLNVRNLKFCSFQLGFHYFFLLKTFKLFSLGYEYE